MSDMPETIWATGGHYWPDPTHKRDKTEYRRADLPPTLSAAMELPEVKALVALLQRPHGNLTAGERQDVATALTELHAENGILRTEKHADAGAIGALRDERDRQYDQNAEQIARMASMELERDALLDALTLVERIYYLEDKDAEWRASRMNGVAREAQDGNDLGHYRRIFPRAALRAIAGGGDE